MAHENSIIVTEMAGEVPENAILVKESVISEKTGPATVTHEYHRQVVASLESQIATLTAQLKDKTVQNQLLTKELRTLTSTSRQKLSHYDSAVQERDALAHQVCGLETELIEGATSVRRVKMEMQARISSLEHELKTLIATLRTRDDTISRLRVDNISLIREAERCAEENQNLVNDLRDMSRFRAQCSELRIELERMSIEDRRYHALLADFNELSRKFEALEIAYARCKKAPVAVHTVRETVTPEPTPRKPMLGIEIKMLDDAAGFKDCVVVVHSVTPGGPGEQAGIFAGDILREWDGVPLDSKATFSSLVDRSQPGDRVIFSTVRGKSLLDIELVVGATNINHARSHRRIKSETVVDDYVAGAKTRSGRALK